jgi:D-glycero-alpha-D-manno-heptose-7-phosphate kinase
VSPRFDDLIYVNYSTKEIVNKVSDLKHELVREALVRTGIQAAVEITMLADVPSEGSGLGSSSSLVVGLLHALYGYKGELVTAEQLAREACEIEIEICGKPIGKQDQYIAAYGGICEFRFRKDDSVGVRRFHRRPELFHNLSGQIMLFYTAEVGGHSGGPGRAHGDQRATAPWPEGACRASWGSAGSWAAVGTGTGVE